MCKYGLEIVIEEFVDGDDDDNNDDDDDCCRFDE
jgi:hypothetical protein